LFETAELHFFITLKEDTTHTKIQRKNVETYHHRTTILSTFCPGGAVLPVMAYTARLRPKEISFSGFKYIKG